MTINIETKKMAAELLVARIEEKRTMQKNSTDGLEHKKASELMKLEIDRLYYWILDIFYLKEKTSKEGESSYTISIEEEDKDELDAIYLKCENIATYSSKYVNSSDDFSEVMYNVVGIFDKIDKYTATYDELRGSYRRLTIVLEIGRN